MSQADLFPRAADVLDGNHYLGSKGARPRLTYEASGCVMVFSGPSSRRLPTDWLELSRWCIVDGVGSQHWARALAWLRQQTEATTVVSYSDPSVGHDGALYRACGWEWAPTWHVLRPPPSGNGVRGGKAQAVKHRWVFLLRPDDRRAEALTMRDPSLARRFPDAGYREPRWKKGKPISDRASAYRAIMAVRSPMP